MDMRHAVHRIVGIYPDRRSADSARVQIERLGLAQADITLLDLASAARRADHMPDHDEVLSALLQGGDIGSVVGSAAGTGVAIALATENLTLVIVGPVLSALRQVGWGVDMSEHLVPIPGPAATRSDLPALIDHSLKAGHVVLVVHTHNDDERARTCDVVSRFVEPCV
jgi:hypothetical protein